MSLAFVLAAFTIRDGAETAVLGLQPVDVVDQVFDAALGGVQSTGPSTATPLDCTLQCKHEDDVEMEMSRDAQPAPAPVGEIDPQNPWGTFLDVRFGALEPFDVNELVAANRRPWYNQTLTRVNDCVVRLGVVHGVYPWHAHREEDEVFFVLDGRLLMDLEGDRTIELGTGQGITVPRGTEHRPRAADRTVILMVEGAAVVPTGS